MKAQDFIKRNIVGGDERDAQVWALITDVCVVKAPICYIIMVLNIIIPGRISLIIRLIGTYRDWNYVALNLLP